MKLLKPLTFILLGCIITVLIAATIVEKLYGTEFATDNLYRSPGFIVLWALFAVSAFMYTIKQKLFRKKAVFLLHLSLILILMGAFTTYIHGKQGLLHLREKETATSFVCKDSKDAEPLPFGIKLERFKIDYYPGTPSPMDYVSLVTITEQGNEVRRGEVAMNKIFSYTGYRFYQSGYDDDGLGTTLAVSYDPWGIGITYTAYGLLLLSMILFFFVPDTKYRALVRKALGKGLVLALFLFLCPAEMFAAPQAAMPKVLPKEVAATFGDLYVLYNDRICPLQTIAKDFTVKLYGKPAYRGLTSEQVFTGWMFFYSSWKSEPMIKVKDGEARSLLGIEGKYAALDDFISPINEYKLDDAMDRIKRGGSGTAKRGIEEADEKYNIIRLLYSGQLLKIFPSKGVVNAADISWYSQSDNLPADMEDNKWLFIKKTQDYIHEMVVKKDYEGVVNTVHKIKEYQRKEAAHVLPSDTRFRAEKLYNGFVYTQLLAMACTTIGLLSFLYYCLCMAVGRSVDTKVSGLLMTLLALVFVYLTLDISLRWFVSGHLPLSNGYETMQFMAWCSLLLAFFMRRRMMFLPFGFLLCGLTLMVSMMGESNPQITQLIPVLSSPLLSAHVVVIMLAYSLFAFMMLNGLAAFILYFIRKPLWKVQVERLQTVSRLLLYPALFCLTVGIFIGAVWANVSWGRYWGWDPKEVWALITMLVYSLAVHSGPLSWFRRPMFFHLFAVVAFLSVLVTYFGVNFVLGGMHSYA